NSTSSMGALHPILFFFLVYGISLFLALFVCRTVYYNLNGEEAVVEKTNTTTRESSTAVALR
ncbi:MAG: hypothetical protein WKF70_15135, partial [Chitinophagaceae bacterium]